MQCRPRSLSTWLLDCQSLSAICRCRSKSSSRPDADFRYLAMIQTCWRRSYRCWRRILHERFNWGWQAGPRSAGTIIGSMTLPNSTIYIPKFTRLKLTHEYLVIAPLCGWSWFGASLATVLPSRCLDSDGSSVDRDMPQLSPPYHARRVPSWPPTVW